MKLTGGCATCVGNTRKINQDAIRYRLAQKKGQYFSVLAVCDGIGGLEKGEVASALVVRRIDEWFDRIVQWLDIPEADPEVVYAHLKDAAEEWNLAVCEYRKSHGVQTGTTLSLLMLLRDRYYTLHVGDSRIYLCGKKDWKQLTVDASVTQMKNGRMKTYLDNYMGKSEELWFTSSSGPVRGGDLFLVCSDGLYHHLLQEDIREISLDGLDEKKAEAACRILIEKMLARGERDNISVGIVAAKQKRKWFERRGE